MSPKNTDPTLAPSPSPSRDEQPTRNDSKGEGSSPRQTDDVTELLMAWNDGDPDALTKLMPMVCDELRTLARSYLDREVPGHTLQPTALVNELYLRLQGRQTVQWRNSAHFFGYAAQTMRRVLVDHARRKKREKRGQGISPVSLDNIDDIADSRSEVVVAIDDALKTLETLDPRQAEIVSLRFFVGLTIEETAAVLQIGTATVKREWQLARLWLYRELNGQKLEG